MNEDLEIFKCVDPSLVQFWKKYGLIEQDFYCTECGKLMLDIEHAKTIEYLTVNEKTGKEFKTPYLHIIGHKPADRKISDSNEQNRWLVFGRDLSGKRYFRHICWDCFFKRLPEIEDIPRRARKSTWYKKILNGDKSIPPTWASPSRYFKLLFDITDEELNHERAKFDTASKESFIRRYGEKEGLLKYEEYRKRQAYTCSKEYMMTEHGMSTDEWNAYNKARSSTKDNFVKRYGEKLGMRKWAEYCAHEGYAGCSLTYFIDKYGEEIGKLKYDEVCNKKNNMKFYSNVSQELFKKIDIALGDLSFNSRYETKNGELELLITVDGIKKIVRPDYIFNTKIIEFYGDYWHANPKIYTAESKFKWFKGQILTADEIWKSDISRISGIKDLGYSVMIVWEKDYNENPDKVIAECVDFLKTY